MKRNEESLRDLWDTLITQTFTLQGSQKENREKGTEKIFEDIIVEKFPNMGKEIATQVQEVLRVSGRKNPRINMPRHIVIKLIKMKDKQKLLKATKEK